MQQKLRVEAENRATQNRNTEGHGSIRKQTISWVLTSYWSCLLITSDEADNSPAVAVSMTGFKKDYVPSNQRLQRGGHIFGKFLTSKVVKMNTVEKPSVQPSHQWIDDELTRNWILNFLNNRVEPRDLLCSVHQYRVVGVLVIKNRIHLIPLIYFSWLWKYETPREEHEIKGVLESLKLKTCHNTLCTSSGLMSSGCFSCHVLSQHACAQCLPCRDPSCRRFH